MSEYLLEKAKTCYHCKPLVDENEILSRRLAELEAENERMCDAILIAESYVENIYSATPVKSQGRMADAIQTPKRLALEALRRITDPETIPSL